MEKLYGITINNDKLLSFFRIATPFVILVKSIESVIRGKFQFQLKHSLLFKLDSLMTWIFYIPMSFFLQALLYFCIR